MTAEKNKIENPEVLFDEFDPPTYESWKEEATALLKGGSFEKKLFTKTYEGITLAPIYTMEMAPNSGDISNFPGTENYLRGTKVGGYITQAWGISQQSDEILPNKLNELLKHELDKGSTVLNIALDDSTRQGKNAEAITKESIKKGGVSLTTLQDVYEALSGIDLAAHGVYIHTGESSASIVAMICAMMQANGETKDKLHGIIGADPIGVLAEKGCLSISGDVLYSEMAELIKWTDKNKMNLRTILIQGQVYNNGGASAVQELGFMLATAIVYIRKLQEQGLDINRIAKNIAFSFALGSNFFMEIAKLRAAKVLWAQIVQSFGGDAESQKMVIHAKTGLFNKTTYDPYVNMLRTTTEAFSAAIGGIDSLETTPFDACMQLPDEFSRRIARNAQLILQNECNLRQPIDPAGGSWYVETLTQQVADKAWQVLQDIENKGGMVLALQNGFVQKDIQDVLSQRFKKLAQRADRVVGVNMYANAMEPVIEKRKINVEEIYQTRAQSVKSFLADIDETYKNISLSELTNARENANFMPMLEQAFAAGATLAEVTAVLNRKNTGIKIEQVVEKHRFSEQFEALRNKARIYESEHGEKLKVFLCNMGNIPQHKPRAEFSTGFFEVGGFEVLKNDGFMTTQEAAKAAVDSGAFAAIICSTDDTYPELVPPTTKQIKAAKPDMVVMVAGMPAPEFVQSYKDSGVEEFIHVRANCLQVLTWMQMKGGIK
ncbi:methylmalonyl-CoA mutase [Propionispira arboris]|uniref:Methylmalonyl-CoA mutase n=1 Tax=Propionispira arboris TaxID=84035 RepID=A0A1H7C825_9FIRM|nr:methylmalonyl-CoA mutase family protein [Propionispira arboris]SEJ85841.1 methylmalonyl-CoA mutase [Propionispira arboris]